MPVRIIKESMKYCLKNKVFFLFLVIILFTMECLSDIFHNYTIDIILGLFVFGYGLQIIEDIIKGGNRLPKIMPKKLVIFGLKSYLVITFYILIQSMLLYLISERLNFPEFNMEEGLVGFEKILMLLFNHDIASFIIFIVSGIVISYVTIFFIELALARLADGEKLKESFSFRSIKHEIDVIGWKRYTVEYTKIILVITVFSYINKFSNPYFGLNVIIGTLSEFMIFTVEYIGMGHIHKIYIDKISS